MSLGMQNLLSELLLIIKSRVVLLCNVVSLTSMVSGLLLMKVELALST